MVDYYAKALASAKKQSLTVEAVGALSYHAVASLAGVKIEANGNSPRDFFFELVRNAVRARLSEEREAFRREAIRAALETAAKNVPGESGSTVTRDGDRFVVSSVGDSSRRMTP